MDGEIKMKSPFDKIIQESETKLASEVINDIIDRTRYWERLYKSGEKSVMGSIEGAVFSVLSYLDDYIIKPNIHEEDLDNECKRLGLPSPSYLDALDIAGELHSQFISEIRKQNYENDYIKEK
jgi:hypothetical protein